MLADRLGRRGFDFTGWTLAAIVSQNSSAAAPSSLIPATIHAGKILASGRQLTSGLVSGNAIALMDKVLSSMFLTKLKLVTALLFAFILTAAGTYAGSLIVEQTDAKVPRTAQTENVTDPDEFMRAELKKLEGTWERLTTDFGGQIRQTRGAALRIEDGQFGWSVQDHKGNVRLPNEIAKVIRIAQAAVDPKVETRTVLLKKPGDGPTFYGLYKLMGDTLVLALDVGGTGHPDRFEADRESKFFVDTFRRIKTPQADFTKIELKKLEGTWERAFTEQNGTKIPIPPGKAILVIRNGQFGFGGEDDKGNLRMPEDVTLAPSHDPAPDPDDHAGEINLTPRSEDSAPMKDVTYFGIYKLRGDTLMLAIDPMRDSHRPDRLTTQPGDRFFVDTFRRIRKPPQQN